MLIEIKGVQFVNKGAELMLEAILKKAHELWPGAEICLAPDRNSPYLRRAKVGAYQKVTFRKNIIDLSGMFYYLPVSLRRYMKNRWGIVTEADIDIVLDASGFNYGDQWSTVLLKQAAIEASRYKRKNKHYVFMPQALGPFSSPGNQVAAKKAFEAASIVFAREEESFRYAKQCTKDANIVQTADFTNLVTPKLTEEYHHLMGKVAIIPNSKMISDKNSNQVWRERYIEVLVDVIQAFRLNGEDVFLLNHEGNADEKICLEVNQRLENPLVVVSPKTAIEVKAIISQLKMVFCSRYHGCVSALSNGVPCLGSSWSHKYEQLFSEYNVSQLLVVPTITKEELNTLVKQSIEQRDDISRALEPSILKFKQSSETMWRKIFDLSQ